VVGALEGWGGLAACGGEPLQNEGWLIVRVGDPGGEFPGEDGAVSADRARMSTTSWSGWK
jgi:hypothetical protein